MIFNDLTRRAMNLAVSAHKDQKDKGGYPYIFHPYRVAENQTTTEAVCVALLHDAVEDGGCKIEEIRKEFGDVIADAVDALTHRKNVPYFEYIENIKKNTLATVVKVADLKDNREFTRIDKPFTDEDNERMYKYYQALQMLTES